MGWGLLWATGVAGDPAVAPLLSAEPDPDPDTEPETGLTGCE